MTWEEVPRVFDVDRAFEHGLDEVAACADYSHYGCRDEREGEAGVEEAVAEEGVGDATHGYGEQHAAYEALDGLLWGYAFVELMPPEGDASEVGTSVVDPYEGEDADDGPEVILPVLEGEEVE